MARVAPRRWLSPDVLGLWGASLALRGAWMVPTLQALLSSVLVAPHGVPYPWWVVPALLAGGGVCRERLASRRRGRLLALGLGLVPAVAVVAATARAETASVAAWGGSLARGLVDCSDGLSASLIVLLGSALVWAWGVCTDRADYGAAGRDAVAGVLVLAMLLALVGPEGFASGLGPAAVVCLYLGVAAAALAVISAQRVQSLERLRPGGAPALSIAWLLVIAPLVGGSVIAGRLMAWLVSAGPVVAAVRLVGRAWQRAIGLLEPALYDLTYLAFRALEALVNGAMDLVRRQRSPPGKCRRPARRWRRSRRCWAPAGSLTTAPGHTRHSPLRRLRLGLHDAANARPPESDREVALGNGRVARVRLRIDPPQEALLVEDLAVQERRHHERQTEEGRRAVDQEGAAEKEVEEEVDRVPGYRVDALRHQGAGPVGVDAQPPRGAQPVKGEAEDHDAQGHQSGTQGAERDPVDEREVGDGWQGSHVRPEDASERLGDPEVHDEEEGRGARDALRPVSPEADGAAPGPAPNGQGAPHHRHQKHAQSQELNHTVAVHRYLTPEPRGSLPESGAGPF